jgi:flagellar biosynthesis protein FliQ
MKGLEGFVIAGAIFTFLLIAVSIQYIIPALIIGVGVAVLTAYYYISDLVKGIAKWIRKDQKK